MFGLSLMTVRILLACLGGGGGGGWGGDAEEGLGEYKGIGTAVLRKHEQSQEAETQWGRMMPHSPGPK